MFQTSGRDNPAAHEEEEENPDGQVTPEHDAEIYRGILSTQVRLVKAFSLSTSLIGLACQPVLYHHLQSGQHNVAIVLGTGAFLSFFTFVTPLLVHFVSKKYVTEMYYDKMTDTYTAITYSLLLRKKQVC